MTDPKVKMRKFKLENKELKEANEPLKAASTLALPS